MLCLIMVAGHSTRLERELRNDTSGEFESLVNVPKALLPGPDGPLLLDQWWNALTNARSRFSDIFMVTVGAAQWVTERERSEKRACVLSLFLSLFPPVCRSVPMARMLRLCS